MRGLSVIWLCALAACGFEHGAIQPPDAFEIVPTVEFEQATSSADEQSGLVQIGVVLSEPSESIVAISYDVTGGNATRPDDFTLADGTLTFLPGQTRRTIDATIAADTLEESDEDIVITLSGPDHATLGATNHHTLTISADILPRVSFGNAPTTSGNEATDETVQAILTIAPTEQLTVELFVAGTATSADHALTDGQTITFGVGEMTKNVPMGVVQDLLDEDDETVELGFKNPSAKLLIAATGNTHTHTITDDDPLPTVQFMTTASSTPESANATITVTLSPVSGRTVTVPYSVTGGTANVADATVVGAPGTLTFTAGQTTQTINVTVMQDTLDEIDETIVITLGTPTNATLGGNATHTLTITDDDDPPSVAFTAANTSATEGDTGTKMANLTLSLSTASGRDVTVPFTVSGTAANPADYTITSSPVTIPAGMTSVNVVVTYKGDTLDEDNETVIVTMGTPTNATQGAITAETLTINDDDAAPSVAFTSAGTSPMEQGQNVTLTVQLSALSGRTVTVPYTINAKSTATDPADYTISPAGQVTIAAGQGSATITIAMVEDALDEDNETVVVDLDTPTNATLGATTEYTLTITDDDALPQVSFNSSESNGSALEGTPPPPTGIQYTYTVVLNVVSGRDVTVPLVYSGTATPSSSTTGADYSGPASVVIPAGQTSANVTITVFKDSDPEGNETIDITFGSVMNATPKMPTSRTHTITNDDT